MKPQLRKLFSITVTMLVLLVGCGGLKSLPQATATPAPASPTEALSVNPGVTGPQVIGRTPQNGERLGLEAVIEIVFDRDMDKDKTAAAWTFFDSKGKAVQGTISWKDARIFAFKPAAKLQPSTVYSAVFSTAAASADGKNPSADIKLEFRSMDALAVGQVFPADGTQDVDVGANITLIFNRPIVPVSIVEEQDKLPQPLKISPQVAGHGEWVNSSVYVFQPDDVLHSGTQYQVGVAAGLADSTGNVLDADYNWQFQTRLPEIAHYSLQNGDQDPTGTIENVLLTQAFVVDFVQPMDTGSVAKALTLVNRESGQAFPTSLKWSKDLMEVVIQPVGRYAIGSFYDLTLDKAAQAKGGGALKNGLAIKFSTVALPGIKEVTPKPGSQATDFDSSISIRFNSPMNFPSLKGKVKITPPLAKEPEMYYDDYNWQLTLYGLQPDTEYVVRLLPGMADIYGNAIKNEYPFSFKTGNIPANAGMLLPWNMLVYREKGPQEFFFDYTNLNTATFSLYRLSFDDFTTQLHNENPLDFTPKSQPIREWQPDLKATKNSTIRSRIKLQGADGNPLPPGYYFIALKSTQLSYTTRFYQDSLFVVATDNITFKATPTEALAWVVDLEKGQPVPDVPVVVYNSNYVEIGKTTTDKQGLAYVKGLTDPHFVRLDDPQHTAFASSDWGSGVSASDFGLWENYYSNTGNVPFAYVYTERPLYRPGQDVFFKGIVRQNDDLHYSLPDQTKVYVTIEQQGEQVYNEYLPLSEHGTFAGTFKLGPDVALGSYDISVRYAPNNDPFAFLSFRVAEYHKPEFQVQAVSDAPNVLVGDPLHFKVNAAYYSGGSVAKANVDWFMEATPYYFQPDPKYGQYNFMDWERDSYWSPPPQSGNGTLAQGQGVTDENGDLDISQIASLGQSTTSQQVAFNANLTDIAGNAVSAHADVVIHQTSVYAGIRSQQYVGKQGEAQSFDVVALDWGSKPVPGQALTVDFVERRWYSAQEQDKQGQLRWVTTVKEISSGPSTKVVTDKDGKATVSFTPRTGGVYKATVTARDAKGHIQQASAYLWVSSDDYISWRQTNDRSFSLIADKSSYTPGDTAEIMIAQPFQGDVYALVTYERGHIYKQEVLLLKGNSTIYKLPITKDMAPMAYISVVVVSGAEATKTPNFKVGMTRINVDTNQQALDVSVSADKKAAGPGDEVTYTVQTKDYQGKPVPAEISLAVVDKAVLALAPANSGPMLTQFYSEQGLGVMTSVGIVLSAEDFNANYHESGNDGQGAGGGGGGKGEGDLGIITVRQDFKDTAFYTAQVMTDENGQAQVKVKFPENLTTWNVDVRAVTDDTRVGQATGELVSTKPLFIEMQTPRFFVSGDAARVGALVHNNGDQDLKVNVSLDAQGVDLKSDAAQTLDVPANQQKYVTWDLAVKPGVERVDFTAHATSPSTSSGGTGSFEDASKPALGTLAGQGIPVYSYHVPETVGTAGILSADMSQTEAFQLPTSLPIYDATLSVEASPSLAASMKDGLTYLQDYPYLCIEQTISHFLPNVVVSRALKLAGQPSLTLQDNLDAQVKPALQRIYAKQNADGGWSWWDAEKSDPQTSAYVVLGLIEARDAGYSISTDVLSRGIDFLKNMQALSDLTGKDVPVAFHAGGGGGQPTPEPPVLTGNELPWEFNRQAFIAYVLARAGEKPLSVGFLYEHRAVMSLYGKAYLAQAIYMVDAQDKHIDPLMSDLNSAAVLSATGAHWEESFVDTWNWNTDTRTTAIVLNAYVMIDPHNPITANAVRWLMASRSNDGHWQSTQETAWTLMSLTNWLVVSKEFDTYYQYAVGLNGKMLKNETASKDNLTQPLKLDIGLKDLLPNQLNDLVFTRGTGPGNLYYSAYMNVTLPVESVQPLDQGMIVSRQYFSLNSPKTAITQAARGDLVRVRLTLVLPESAHYVVLNDPLPAGLEAVDASILTNTQVPTNYTRQDFDTRGWGWWYFSHIEQRDEKVVLSSDYLPAGTYVYTYLARASTAGVFKVIPPNAAEFYFPDVGGRGAGSIFTVK